ncbi:hypothetical protein KC331_g16214 [Hortaea werneckii]|nr:hypothetical protein KC331_g16214 [Hortaea werneckii]KAI7706292.1 hypothetical protein KC353_g12337 [Hortaea werneckii]
MNQHRVEQSVTKESGNGYQYTAGSRHEDAQPLPSEAAQLEAEAAKQELPLPIKGSGCVDQADVESRQKPKRHGIADMLHLPHRGDDHKDKEQQEHRSISADGPLQVIKDPRSGLYITRPNPHWPEEDSWKREDIRSGKGDSDVVPPSGMGGISYY